MPRQGIALMVSFVMLTILLLIFVGPFLVMLALNYIFWLLYSWHLLGSVITITFWESFWLVIAFIIIRVVLFGQHLSLFSNMYRPMPLPQPQQRQRKPKEPESTSYR